VEKAEASANNVIRAAAMSELNWLTTTATGPLNTANAASLRMHYGGEDLTFKSDGVAFKFSVSEAGWDSIWVYPNASDELYAMPVGTIGEFVKLEALQKASQAIGVRKGQMACFRSPLGFVLVLRLLSANLPERDKPFEVSVSFAIYGPDRSVLVP
jgi:hypothetical protein